MRALLGTLATVCLLAAVAALVAWPLRYVPLPPAAGAPGVQVVWDRWAHRYCVAHIVRFGSPTGPYRFTPLDCLSATGGEHLSADELEAGYQASIDAGRSSPQP